MMRELVKSLIWLLSFIIVGPLVFLSKLGTGVLGTDELYIHGSQSVSLVPGKFGCYLRRAYCKCTLEKFDMTGCQLIGSLVAKRETRLGKSFSMGAYCLIGLADIGDNVAMGSRVSIMSGRYQHNFNDLETGVLERDGSFSRLVIGDDVFIGEQSVVMANVGEKSIIGAGSIVVNDIPPYSVAVGNPAKVIKTRSINSKTD